MSDNTEQTFAWVEQLAKDMPPEIARDFRNAWTIPAELPPPQTEEPEPLLATLGTTRSCGATRGTNTETGHAVVAQVDYPTTNDGWWWYAGSGGGEFSNLAVQWGCISVLSLLPEIDELPESELQAQFNYGPNVINAFLQFDLTGIGKGWVINKAYLQVCAKGTQTSNLVSTINAYDGSNPGVPGSASELYLQDLILGPDWDTTATWTDAQWYNSPEITCLIQTLIDRADWPVNGGMVRILLNGGDITSGLRTVYDYSETGLHDKQAKLLLWYRALISETGSSGVKCNGTTAPLVKYNERGSSGVSLGGSARVWGGQSATMSGGCRVSGNAVPGRIMANSTSGGVRTGGVARCAGVQTIRTTGGIKVSGYGYRVRVRVVVNADAVRSNLNKFFLGLALRVDPQLAAGNFQVTDSSGVVKPHWVGLRNTTTGDVVLYVKTDLTGDDQLFYVYFRG